VLGRSVGEICGTARPNTHTGADFFYARAARSADACVAEPRNETGTQRVGLCGSARSRRAASPRTGRGVGWVRRAGSAVSWGLASAAAPALDGAATPIGGRNCGWWRGGALQQRRGAAIGPRLIFAATPCKVAREPASLWRVCSGAAGCNLAPLSWRMRSCAALPARARLALVHQLSPHGVEFLICKSLLDHCPRPIPPRTCTPPR